MSQYTRYCRSCGKEYEYCYRCDSFASLPTWMTLFHDENCKDLFFIASDYYMKAATDEQLKERLDKCDLSNKDALTDKIKYVIKQLLKKPITDESKENQDEGRAQVYNKYKPKKNKKW